MKPTQRWLKKAAFYERFKHDWSHADWSVDAAIALFAYESYGTPISKSAVPNGYLLGKQWLDVTMAMWQEDIALGTLSKQELIDDGWGDCL